MPLLAFYLTHAMLDAVRQHARIQTRRRGHRVTMSDVVVASLRLSGFERDDVLEALANGESVDIDVRVRPRGPLRRRDRLQQVREYCEAKRCIRLRDLYRFIHLPVHDVNRGLDALFDAKLIEERPFDRPRIIHWIPTCQCKTLLAGRDDRRIS